MADKVTTSLDLELKFTLADSTRSIVKSRTIAFPIKDATSVSVSDWWKNTFYDKFFEKYKWIIQPTGWRDSDDTEEAYECTEVVATIISTTETELGV